MTSHSAAVAMDFKHRGKPHVSQDINVLVLVKGDEKYVFLFDDARQSEALRTLGRYASNPELSFSWYDAAVLSQKIRRVSTESIQDFCDEELRFDESTIGDGLSNDDPFV